jgi:hypothetical protein
MKRPIPGSESSSLVRWVFGRGSRVLTCEVQTNGDGQFDVCVVPLWDIQAAIIEAYDRASKAMRRHAEIAAAFRQAGWVVARETTKHGTEVAA